MIWCPVCFANSFLFFKVLLSCSFLLFVWLGNNSEIVNIIFMEKYAIWCNNYQMRAFSLHIHFWKNAKRKRWIWKYHKMFLIIRNKTYLLLIIVSYSSLTHPVSVPDEEKKLSFYFRTALWCLKRFYEGLKGFHKIFWGTKKKCENKNLS